MWLRWLRAKIDYDRRAMTANGLSLNTDHLILKAVGHVIYFMLVYSWLNATLPKC